MHMMVNVCNMLRYLIAKLAIIKNLGVPVSSGRLHVRDWFPLEGENVKKRLVFSHPHNLVGKGKYHVNCWED